MYGSFEKNIMKSRCVLSKARAEISIDKRTLNRYEKCTPRLDEDSNMVRGTEVMYFIARQKSAKAWLCKHLNRQLRVCLISWPGPFRAFRNPTERFCRLSRSLDLDFRLRDDIHLNPIERPRCPLIGRQISVVS